MITQNLSNPTENLRGKETFKLIQGSKRKVSVGFYSTPGLFSPFVYIKMTARSLSLEWSSHSFGPFYQERDAFGRVEIWWRRLNIIFMPER